VVLRIAGDAEDNACIVVRQANSNNCSFDNVLSCDIHHERAIASGVHSFCDDVRVVALFVRNNLIWQILRSSNRAVRANRNLNL
jgi:hypothetical protein